MLNPVAKNCASTHSQGPELGAPAPEELVASLPQSNGSGEHDAFAEIERLNRELQAAQRELERTRQELEVFRKGSAALVEAEMRLRLVIEAADLGLWDWDIKTNSVYHSPEWKRQIGYEDYEISNSIDEWLNRLHPDDKARVQAAVELYAKVPQPGYDMRFRLRHRDGSYRWIHSQGRLLTENGVPVRMMGVHVDITAAREKAEEHGRLAAIIESSNDAIVGETLEGIVTDWNKSAERIYGYAASEIVGRSVRILVPGERHAEITEMLERIKKGEVIDHFETLRVRKDGRQIHVSLVVSPIRDASGRVLGLSAIARDITERKQLEAEVLHISEREQQRIARDLHDGLGQLLSGTVHLANVLQLELAEQALPEAAEALRITELLNEAVAETRSLAHGLYPVGPEPNGLTVALSQLAARTRELFKVRCTFQCGKAAPVNETTTATHLYRIAQEAVANAVKHGRAERIEIALTANPERIVLTVRDDGCGFPPGPASRKGLGIRIMQYRAAMMGGALALHEKRGQGTAVVCNVLRTRPRAVRDER
jgi:PAS domain S-box-containing protein